MRPASPGRAKQRCSPAPPGKAKTLVPEIRTNPETTAIATAAHLFIIISPPCSSAAFPRMVFYGFTYFAFVVPEDFS